MKRSRPRKRSPYRDSVLTVPCDKERFQLEEEKIKQAYNKPIIISCTCAYRSLISGKKITCSECGKEYKMTTLNLNQIVIIKLTKSGVQTVIHSEWTSDKDKNDAVNLHIWKGQIWKMARLFGHLLTGLHSKDVPFESMNVEIEKIV